MSPTVSVVSETQCRLGEGLHWDTTRMVLWMVDILGQNLLQFDPANGVLHRRALVEPTGWVLPIRNSEFLLIGLSSGIAAIEAVDRGRPIIWIDRTFPGEVGLRLNDAKADKFGRVWAGSMSKGDDTPPVGSLARYSFDGDGWKFIDTGYSVPNGPAFNVDGTLMLQSDSSRGVVYRFDLDPETGDVIGRSIWRQFPPEAGYPDGMTFDAEGCVWIAHWGIGQVCRYESSGRLDLVVKLPTLNVTNVCFGGATMDRLFVSSARHGLKEPDPLAGSLFEVTNHGVRGIRQWDVSEAENWTHPLIRIS